MQDTKFIAPDHDAPMVQKLLDNTFDLIKSGRAEGAISSFVELAVIYRASQFAA